MMKITFFGAHKSFDYRQVGGMDSLARRLGGELACMGFDVSFVHFDCPFESSETTPEGIRLRYFTGFKDSLKYLSGGTQHVITIYVPPRHRPAWMFYRKLRGGRTRFHMYYSCWPELWLKRNLGFMEARLCPYNGTLFAASPRILKHISGWAKRTSLLLPPVPKAYFVAPGEKKGSDRLRVTFMGRIDPKKGTGEVLALFKYLAVKAPDIKTLVSGYYWEKDHESVKLHEELSRQKDISYAPVEFEGYSLEVEETARRLLRETDILFLPYDRLSSTVDTPLLLLEGMAHLCIVVTRPLGSMPDVYGTSEFMLDSLIDHEACLGLFRQAGTSLIKERKRLAAKCSAIGFKSDAAAKTLLSSIGDKY
ncbi:MAG: glycosyltransferase [Thermodesulfovibrionales bacterium]